MNSYTWFHCTGLEDKEEDVAAVMAAVLSLRNNKEGFSRVINTTIDRFYLRMSDFLDAWLGPAQS